MTSVFQEALQQSIETTRFNLRALEEFPESFKRGHWRTIEKERPAGHWVDGFWTGLLWLAWAHSGDAEFKQGAERWSGKLAHLKTSGGTRDLGFIFTLSHVLGRRLTGDASLAEIATQHARTSRLALLRGDGSSAHVADFDPQTGLLIRQEQYQGYSHDSCWSRGQAWGLYGFATCYRYTAIPGFLTAARALADYTQRNLPRDLVPFWDYNSPHIPDTYRDSSAAAVTVCGLVELSAVDLENAARWLDLAERMFHSLCDNYLVRAVKGPSSILRDGARSVPAKLMEHGLIYGDYYFLEALTAFTRPDLHQRAFAVEQAARVAGD